MAAALLPLEVRTGPFTPRELALAGAQEVLEAVARRLAGVQLQVDRVEGGRPPRVAS